MPSLTPADRVALLGPTGPCPRGCGVDRVKHYCRTCDEFFCSCACHFGCLLRSPHVLHRLYVWTPAGVLAIPDFDAVSHA